MAKNKAAAALGRLRWAGKTKAQKRAHMKMMSRAAAKVRSAKALQRRQLRLAEMEEKGVDT